ncbi:MAG: hypothetical protein EON57_05235 [Alphaproteobacteria bacterium]|nr:MAG: hypothetical protein EON57_05235 [Alphaproteobacteria bacterium]
MDNADSSATSIGQEDQLRDREMLREERKRDSLKGDAEPDSPNAWPAGGAPPEMPPPGKEIEEDDGQPAKDDPPDG